MRMVVKRKLNGFNLNRQSFSDTRTSGDGRASAQAGGHLEELRGVG